MSQGKESSATLLGTLRRSDRGAIPNPRYVEPGDARGGRGRARGRGRAGGRAGGRGPPSASGSVASELPSASGSVASQFQLEDEVEHEAEVEHEDEVEVEGEVEGEVEAAPKLPKRRGEAGVPDEADWPTSEDRKAIIVPNRKE